MGIFTRLDIEEAEREGSFIVRNKQEIGNAGIDLRVKQLYTVPRDLFEIKEIYQMRNHEPPKDLSRENFIKRLIEVPMEDGDFWLLLPGHHYLATTEEEIFKEQFFFSPIFTRSSWARCGVRVEQADHDELVGGRKFEGTPLLSISTFGTHVKLRPGDAPGQIVPSVGSEYVHPMEVGDLIAQGILRIERDGKQLKAEEFEYDNNGVILTLDKKIRKYKGGIIDPRKSVDKLFEEIILDEKEFWGNKGEFFISSTAETVSICSCHIGFVWHSMHHISRAGWTPMYNHPNAPLIHSRSVFNGKITLEHYPHNAYVLRAGMPITSFGLRRMQSPMWSGLWKGKESRYKGQSEATSSRGYIKP
ncbi:hypothetical protein KY326_02195 [Candidatus Woesearchaeota archaeon]|nr:hypothetical protein [Candidatus Woesearchaeota archaeon]